MSREGWEHFPHQADMGVRGRAPTLGGAFAQAAVALTAIITDPQGVSPTHMVEVECNAPDHELLLADWLNGLLYEMATRHMVFSHFEVHIEDHQLRAQAWGEQIDARRHSPAVEVKGATYTELRVYEDPEGTWVAQCVVDV
jgi:SHS2 domain-containing protein